MKNIERIVCIFICLTLIATATCLASIGVVAVGTTETEILPAKPIRRFFVLQNNSTNDVYVKWDASTNAVTTNNGVKIAANGGSLSVVATGGVSPAANRVTAISASGTNSIRYQEGNEK